MNTTNLKLVVGAWAVGRQVQQLRAGHPVQMHLLPLTDQLALSEQSPRLRP